MSYFKRLILIFLFLTITACAESESSGSGGSSSSVSNDVYTLSWSPPSKYENGEDLQNPSTNLLEYRIYYGSSSNSVTDNFISVNSTSSSVSTNELSQTIIANYPTVYLAMTSVSLDGVESTLSEVVQFNP